MKQIQNISRENSELHQQNNQLKQDVVDMRDKVILERERRELVEKELNRNFRGELIAHQQLTELKQHLREIEWYDDETYTDYRCPACFNLKHEGHTDTCWLAQAIRSDG